MTIDPIQQPNSFTNPPNYALSPFLYFLILPRFTFIIGRIALILQNPLFFTSFFRNSALIRARSYFRLGNKNKQDLFCISLDFS